MPYRDVNGVRILWAIDVFCGSPLCCVDELRSGEFPFIVEFLFMAFFWGVFWWVSEWYWVLGVDNMLAGRYLVDCCDIIVGAENMRQG